MPSAPEPIAIVGLGGVFPGAGDIARYWENLIGGVDAIREVPPDRIDPVYFRPPAPGAVAGPEHLYCRRGGFLESEAVFDPLAFGVMPRAAEGAEPDQLLMLQVAKEALRDAGLEDEGEWRRRTAVIFGRGGYLTPGLVRLDQRIRTAEQLVTTLAIELPQLAEATLEKLKRAFQAQLGPFGPDTAIGLVPNLAASRVANRLDLGGPAYVVDAACASSLVAVDQACRELRSGRSDVALVGGVHVCQDVTFWSVFTQLGALSRAGQIRPFDRRADGLLIGEGAGLLILQRLADARRDGRRVYARLLGSGISSDGRGTTLLNPRTDGQILALQRAWEEAAVDPTTVGFVEAHGTGTVQGDEAELATLARFFGPAGDGPRASLGSVKSMIGHAMPAAGAAGLIKAALALHHGAIPPSLHCEEPHPNVQSTRFRVPTTAEAWPELPGPRRAGVNAFGFGGINAHLVLEEAEPRQRRRVHATPLPAPDLEPPLILAAEHTAEMLEGLEGSENRLGTGPLRLVLFQPTPERRALARKVVLRELPWRDHNDLWFSPNGMLRTGGRVAFLFPGIEPTFDPRIDDVAERFGLTPPPLAGGLEETGLAVVAVSRLLMRALSRLGIHPDLLAGHSIGEWTGLVISEQIPADFAQPFIDSLVPGTLSFPDVVFAMVGCSDEKVQPLIADLPEVAVSHDNCPHQVILCGPEARLDVALGRLREAQVLTQKLPFRSGFHSPLFADYLAPLQSRLAEIPLRRGQLPLWSATTCAPYPDDPDAVRSLCGRHLVETVRFRALVEKLYAEGVRAFVQVGAGNGLGGFVEDTLRGRPFLSVSTNLKKRSGLDQLRRVLAALYCEGLSVDPLQLDRVPPRPPRLQLGVPLPRLPALLAAEGLQTASAPRTTQASALQRRFSESLQHVTAAQAEVLAALEKPRPPAEPPPVEPPGPKSWTAQQQLSVESHPYLLDHCFYRQPAGWPDMADRFPVVPATLSLDWLFETASALNAGPVRALENVFALRWLAVAPPIQIVRRAELVSPDRATVAIEGYARGEARLAGEAPVWQPPPPLAAPQAVPVQADALYRDRWMFHGPAYQGVTALTAWDPNGLGGMDGEIVVTSAPGAWLDNAGQVFGLWVMLRAEKDRLALPVRLDRVERFGPPPNVGDTLKCAVRLTAFTEREARADLWLWHADGRPLCRVLGWEDRRFDSDDRLWHVLRWPERELLSLRRPAGYFLVTDAWRQLPSRELLARRYLSSRERAQWEALPSRRQGQWLNGRIAVKDAVRDLLWRRGQGPLFPVEIEVDNDPAGRLLVRGVGSDVHVSLAHVEGAAVALASDRAPVGIDFERPQPRLPGFADTVLSPEEQRRLPALDPLWLTRVWTAKEAAAKAAGTGLSGDPRNLVLQACEEERMLVSGRWITFAWDDPFVVSWSSTS